MKMLYGFTAIRPELGLKITSEGTPRITALEWFLIVGAYEYRALAAALQALTPLKTGLN